MSTLPPEQNPQSDAPPATPPSPSPYPRDMSATGSSSLGFSTPAAEERQQAMLCWILSIFAGFIPGLIFFLIANEKPYVKRQAALALTLSIVTFVGFIASAILMIVLIGIFTYIAFGIWALVVCIMGAIATNKGENFSPKYVDKICMSLFKL